MNNRFIFLLIIFIFSFILFSFFYSKPVVSPLKPKENIWQFRSVDTMKYSRDLSREKLRDNTFDAVIDQQMKEIAGVGATYVAIATPYDEEFVPILKRWVASARAHNLHVWFRGNFSGWEGWFGYDKITREEHMQKTEKFILNHPELFEDGDVFSACPECENGGPGDPRETNDILGHQQFLIKEYQITKKAFETIHKQVASNYVSMNADVARKVMDKATTRALDGIVTIDHYVESPEQFANDAKEIAENSGGKVIIGEFGAPIPDIHGDMTDEQQKQWIQAALANLAEVRSVIGVNYWVGTGGSTQIWDASGTAHPAVAVLRHWYTYKR